MLGLIVPKLTNKIPETLIKYGQSLMESFRKNADHIEMQYPNQEPRIIEVLHPACSKKDIDNVDEALTEHYGFTEEELDYIINYDIKYRMGKELNEE